MATATASRQESQRGGDGVQKLIFPVGIPQLLNRIVDTQYVARLRRNYVPGAVHHTISRFHSGAYRLRDVEERDEYLRRLAIGLAKTDWQLLAFALMSTHLHLALLAGSASPGPLFGSVHGSFAQWLNRRQSVHGQLFAGRYRLWAVRRPTAELIAYLHNNPVRAGVVTEAAQSSWTSHRFYSSPKTSPRWLAVERGLALSGFADGAELDRYVRNAASNPREMLWSGEHDASAVRSVAHAAGAAVEVSEPIISETSIYAVSMRPRAFAEICSDFTPEQVLEAVGVATGMSRREFCGRSKLRDAVRARRLALRLWRSMRGPQCEMSAALGMSSSAASGLLHSNSEHHLGGDEEGVWLELQRRYPQKI